MPAAMEPRHWNAMGEGSIAQQWQIETVAAEGHEDRARSAAVNRKALDEAEQQFDLGLLGD